MTNNAEKMMSLFNGRTDAYGQFVPGKVNKHKNKLEGSYKTIQAKVDVALWELHLTKPNSGLGIIPIRQDNTCNFAAIDIDDYEISHEEILDRIKVAEVPVLPARSKSGGLHLYMFFDDFVTAGLAQDVAKKIASILGFGRSEIFPKQRELNPEIKHFGSFINIPYAFGTQRVFLTLDGNELTIDQFFQTAGSMKLDQDWLEEFMDCPHEIDAEELGDSKDQDLLKQIMPCIINEMKLNKKEVGEFCIKEGKDGGRNNWLFQYAMGAKDKWPVSFPDKVKEFNQQFCKPPIEQKEVDVVLKQVSNGDYGYFCKRAEFQNVCDKAACFQGKTGPTPGFFLDWGPMVIVMSDPKIYYWTINDKEVKLSAQELTSFQQFRTALLEHAQIDVAALDKFEFSDAKNTAMKEATFIEVEKVSSRSAILLDLLRQFCQTKSASKEARKPDAVNRNMVHYNRDLGKYVFKMNSFVSYLSDRNIRDFDLTDINGIMRKDWQTHEAFQEKHGLEIKRFNVLRDSRPTCAFIKFPDDLNIFDNENEVENNEVNEE